MQSWGWLIVYLVGFGLLQVLLYVRFGRRESTPSGSSRSRTSAGSSAEPATASVECRHCGAANEVTRNVRYCRACVEPLD